MVEEHATHDLGQYLLGCTSDAGIIQKVTLGIFRLRVDGIGQPAYQGVLVEATRCLQQLDATQDTTKLVLPATTGGEQLFEDERTTAYLVLIPCQRAEVVDSSQDGRCQDAAGAKATACGNGRQQRQLNAAAEAL